MNHKSKDNSRFHIAAQALNINFFLDKKRGKLAVGVLISL